jgi:hypothetical protein
LSNGRIPTLLAVILLLALAACGGYERANGEQAAGEPKNKRDVQTDAHVGEAQAIARSTTGNGDAAVARAGEAVARAGGNARAWAGDAVAKAGGEEAKADSPGDDEDAQEVTLQIEGDPGTAFSGTCIVGDEKREISGQVPERFVYELGVRKLECEIHKRGRDAGAMKIVLTAGNINHVQQTESQSSIVKMTYSARRGSSSSIQASTLSGSASQTITSNSSSRSSR